MKTTKTQGRAGCEGSALIMVLCLIALVTTAAVAFFSRATDDAAEEGVRAQQLQVTQVCETGVDHALAGVLSQIPGNSVPFADGSGSVTYLPASPSYALPARALAQGAMASDGNFDNLLVQSIRQADQAASADATSVPSRNGRSVDPVRWGKPQLLASGFTSTNQLPCWVYVNRDGSLTNAPTASTVGRFAYNVYDLGGLLDANVAGYPTTVPVSDMRILKGTVAGADLTQLPGVTRAAVDALVAFRNPLATNGNYASCVVAGASRGFLSPVASNATTGGFTNNFFTTRQDLIRYAQYQNTPLTNALPYLTHFTRELARPSLTNGGLNNMTARCDLSRLTSPALLGLSGNFPNLSHGAALSPANTSAAPDLFQTLRSSISYVYSWETNAPTNVFSTVSWPTNTDLKAVAIGANIIDQFTTNSTPVRITYNADTVAGKKQLPYVSRVFLVYNTFIQTQSNGNNNNNKNTNNNSGSSTNWMNGKAVGNPSTGNNGNDKSLGNTGSGNTFWITFSVIPQVYAAADSGLSMTARLASGTLTLGGVTNIVLPNSAANVSMNVSPGCTPVYASTFGGNSAAMGFFATSYGWQGTITNSTLSVSLNGLSFELDDGSGSVYSDFGTNAAAASNAVVSAPFSISVTLTNISSATSDTGTLVVDGVAVEAIDPRTLRGAGRVVRLPYGGDTNSLSTNIVPVTTNYAPATIVDTNWTASLPGIASVGELGRVFRESPWRTIDFVSINSPDKALLDVMSAYPAASNGLRAGVLNLNTPHPEILAALLSGAPTGGSGTITASSALSYAANMVALTSASPMTNRMQLVDLVASNVIASAGDTDKTIREAAIRALGEPGQTRTWNLLVDVIAQSGNFAKATPSAVNFNVTGERRVWVSAAVDRPACRVVDVQSEEVGE